MRNRFVSFWMFALLVPATLLRGWPAENSVSFPRSEWRDIASASTKDVHRIFVYHPEGTPPKDGFPVVYVLDGNAYFPLVTQISRLLSVRPEATGVSPFIVVGIGYPGEALHDSKRRARDYTPTTNHSTEPTTGGADAFLRFIEEELKPALARELPIDPQRQTLLGHSYGGLFVVHALLTRPTAFQNYVAISPSLWFGDCAVLKSEIGFEERLTAAGGNRRVFISVGEYEQKLDPSRPMPPGRTDKLRQNRMIDNAREFTTRLAALPRQPLRVQFIEFPEENHASIVPVSVTRSLPWILTPAP